MTEQATTPLATFFPHPTVTPAERDADFALLRQVADSAGFFALCRQGGGRCTREKRCRGNPRDCVGRFAGLLPEEVHGWIEATFEGYSDHLGFEALAEKYPDELAAMVEWRAALDIAFGPRRRGGTA